PRADRRVRTERTIQHGERIEHVVAGEAAGDDGEPAIRVRQRRHFAGAGGRAPLGRTAFRSGLSAPPYGRRRPPLQTPSPPTISQSFALLKVPPGLLSLRQS